jgi:hypothetical protein
MDQQSYFRSHPPRCIAGFNATPVELTDAKFDGHPSLSELNLHVPAVSIEAPEHINPVFALKCSCGSARHFVHGFRWTNPDFDNAVVFLSPLSLECASCRKQSPLLDTDVHGYDAEQGGGSATVRGQGEPVVFECPQCGRQPLEALVRFEYPDDLFDGDFPEFAGRQQDLFTWFSLLGRCPQCSKLLAVADFECA